MLFNRRPRLKTNRHFAGRPDDLSATFLLNLFYMAKILGEPGRYVAQQSAKKYRRFILAALAGCCLLSFLLGAFLVYQFALPHPSPLSILLPPAFLLLIILIGRVMSRRMDAHEKDRISFLKGATGEQAVAKKTDELPDEYCVIQAKDCTDDIWAKCCCRVECK